MIPILVHAAGRAWRSAVACGLALLVVMAAAPGYGQTPAACRASAAADLLKATAERQSAPIELPSSIIPDGSWITIIVDREYSPDHVYRGLFVERFETVDSRQRSTEKVVVRAVAVSQAKADEKRTELRYLVPALESGHPWAMREITVVACAGTGTEAAPLWVATTEAEVSGKPAAVIVALICVLAIYLGAAAVSHRVRRESWSLDPVIVTQDNMGRGSISRLQMMLFTMIVAGLLVYIMMRTGILSALSNDVLFLLGIAGGGTAAAKLVAVNRFRLSGESWSWALRKGWIDLSRTAQWRDLFTTSGELDIYKFQMLIFTLIVAAAFLGVGLTELASFTIPPTVLGVLGLSQVIYVGGKLVGPSPIEELDKQIAELRTLEQAFIDAVVADPAWKAGPHTLAVARAIATAPYEAYRKAAKRTSDLFVSTFDEETLKAEALEPATPPAP